MGNELSMDSMAKSWGLEEDIITTLVHALDDEVDECDKEGDDEYKYLIDEESSIQILHRTRLDWRLGLLQTRCFSLFNHFGIREAGIITSFSSQESLESV